MSDRQPPTGKPKTAFAHFNFHVDFGGGVEAGFTDISGLDAPGGRHAHDGPAKRRLPVVALKRGLAGDAFSKWILEAGAGRIEHRDVRIRLLDEMMRTVMTWTLTNARPIKIEGPTLNGKGNDVAIEGIELHCDGIDCAKA